MFDGGLPLKMDPGVRAVGKQIHVSFDKYTLVWPQSIPIWAWRGAYVGLVLRNSTDKESGFV